MSVISQNIITKANLLHHRMNKGSPDATQCSVFLFGFGGFFSANGRNASSQIPKISGIRQQLHIFQLWWLKPIPAVRGRVRAHIHPINLTA